MRRGLALLLVAGCVAVPSADGELAVAEPIDAPGASVVPVVPDEDAPAPAEPVAEDEPTPRFVAVAPTDEARLAIWTADSIARSDDDGRTFVAVLETAPPIHDVALDEGGRLWAVAGAGLGVHAPDGTERWRALPFGLDADGGDGPVRPRLAVARGALALAVSDPDPETLAIVHVTRDGGDTWSARLVRATVASSSIGVGDYRALSIDAHGKVTLHVSWGQGVECGVTYDTIFVARRGRGFAMLTELADGPLDLHRAHDGWLYGACGLDDDPLCALPPPPRGVEVDLPAWRTVGPQAGELSAASRPGQTLALADDGLWRLTAGRGTRLADTAAPGATLRAVDAVGRAYADAEGIQRWSPDAGWQPLPGPS